MLSVNLTVSVQPLCMHLSVYIIIAVFVSTDLKDAKLVGKVWRVNVLTNESITLTLSVADEYKQYVTIGKESCTIIGKL